MVKIRPAAGPVVAAVHLPGSKSYTNRALLVAALADGQSVLRGVLFSDDTEVMCRALGALGVPVEADPGSETMTLIGSPGGPRVREAKLFGGNAGTAVRFLTAYVALGHGRYVIDGTHRMRERPQQPLLDALNQLGVAASGHLQGGFPPLTITADGCRGGRVAMDGSQSSQYFSALAMVAPAMAEGLDLEVRGELVSKPYLDLTADVMAAFGVALVNHDYHRFTVAPGQRYTAGEYRIEADASAASYFLAAAAVTGGRVTVYGLHRTSCQGDVRFVDILELMGCRVTDDDRGLTVSGPERLHGVCVDMNDISDTALTLAAIAPFALGPTEIRNIEHVRRQESDRIAAAATELARLGVDVEERRDGWLIQPGLPHGGEVETYDDHRLAMSFALIGLKVPGVHIRGPECVSKTFPDFFARFAALTAAGLV